uniref:Venom protein n=1 Tax=Ampulex compressa TaxID=860918 RepID=A0A1W6EWA4_AMPCP|nr:venom protein [Ampulex compressa]
MGFVALCMLTTFCTVLATDNFDDDTEYTRVKTLITKEMESLDTLMHYPIYMVLNEFNEQDSRRTLPPLTSRENDNGPQDTQSDNYEKCQRDAVISCQSQLERMKAIYSLGSSLLQNLQELYDSCSPTEGMEQLRCASRKMDRDSFTEKVFQADATSAIAEAKAASDIAIRKISSCLFFNIVVNDKNANATDEKNESAEYDESVEGETLVGSVGLLY